MATDYAAATQGQVDYFFDLRPYFNAFECPPPEVLGAAIRATFIGDSTVVFRPMRAPLLGVFRVSPLGPPGEEVIHLQRTRRDTGALEDVAVPLTTSNPTRRTRQDGDLLITICDAAERIHASVPGKAFDTALAGYGRLVIPTRAQKNKDTGLNNGNRYCVINREDFKSNPLPNRLRVNGFDFLIKYRGKTWFCDSCATEHTGPCDYLKEFYAARDAKANTPVDLCVVGDSSLRHAEHVGLKADIFTMSGAAGGQVAQAVLDNPSSNKYSTVVLAFGANDTKASEQYTMEETLMTIDRSLANVERVTQQKPNVNFHLLNTTPPNQALSEDQYIVNAYLKNSLTKLVTASENVDEVSLSLGLTDFTDNHPNISGTTTIMNSLVKINPSILLNEKFLVTERIYAGVNTLWLSGCTGCSTRGHFSSRGFCSTCLKGLAASEIRHKSFLEAARSKYKLEFPDSFAKVKRPFEELSSSSSDERHVAKK